MEAQTNVETPRKASITALQGLQPRAPSDVVEHNGYGNESQSGPSRSTSPPAGKDCPDGALQEQKVVIDVPQWMHKLWRRHGDRWITHGDYYTSMQHSQDQGQSPATQGETVSTTIDDPGAAVYLDSSGTMKHITIRSKHLIKAINTVNKHPYLSKQPQTAIELREPFPLLYYHLKDIKREISQLNLPDADEDFKALECAAQEAAPRWKAARAAMPSESGFVQYDTIWTLFQAGDLVLFEDDLGEECALTLVDVLENCIMENSRGTSKLFEKRYIEIRAWGLVWNTEKLKLERKVARFRIDHFSGTRALHLLPVYPLRYRQRSVVSEAEFLEALAKRGRKWFELVTRVPYLECDGAALDCGKYIKRSNPVRLETRKAGSDTGLAKVKLQSVRVIVTPSTRILTALILNHTFEYKATEFDTRKEYQWDNLRSTSELTDEQARLCVPIIGCHTFKSKMSYLTSVNNLQPVTWNPNAMDHLVMEDDKKRLLEGLVSQHYSRKQGSHRGDFVANKGEGLVILLHGPPGVGKSLTAESLSHHVKKPLISLSIGDLIWDESKLQERLAAEFTRAIEWDAMLLLDEADVILEARSFEDVRRNGMVSVFLRELEYYKGVLFLTTNRISTMDVAFQSRIQIGIGFQELIPSARRQIWLNLINLNKDKTDPHTLGKLRSNVDKLAEWDLNGREIRNVLNIADAYAYREHGMSSKMKYEHVVKAARATLDFKALLESERSNLRTGQSVWEPYSG